MQKHVGEQERNSRPLRGSTIPLDQRAVVALQRRFEPPFHGEQDPPLVGVVSHRLQDRIPRDGVEGTHDTRPTSTASRRRSGSSAAGMRGRDGRLS